MDSLYSIVHQPRGAPCATVAIGNSTNGALLVICMLSTALPHLVERIHERYQHDMEQQVMDEGDARQQQGGRTYKP